MKCEVSLDFDVENFRSILMMRLGDLFRRKNRGVTEYEFDISINRAEDGLAIFGWDQPYLDSRLIPALIHEGLLESTDTMRILPWVNYCQQIEHPVSYFLNNKFGRWNNDRHYDT